MQDYRCYIYYIMQYNLAGLLIRYGTTILTGSVKFSNCSEINGQKEEKIRERYR